jgi:membrane protein
MSVSALRRWFERSWIRALAVRLNELDVGNQATLLGAGLLASLLPLMMLLSAFANERVDDDIALRLGLNREAADIVSHLFQTSSATVNGTTIVSLLLVFAGTIAVASSLRQIYEKAFRLVHRAHGFARLLVWVAVLCGVIAFESVIGRPVRRIPGGSVFGALVGFALFTAFFLWTIHFLLSGRVAWRRLLPSALATGLLFALLGLFSEFFFSSWIVSDNKLYGSVGPVFSILTWLIAVGAVLIIGAVGGVVWQERAEERAEERRDR